MKRRSILILCFLCLIIASCFCHVNTETYSDLVLWLKFDGDFLDSSTKGYHARPVGNVTFVEGRDGQAVLIQPGCYVMVDDKPEFSIVNNPNGMTISFWICPSTHSFKTQNEYGYIRFLGKGDTRQQEWCFTIYNASNPVDRPYRICFYIHNASGGYGIGAYVQEPYDVNEWIFITGVIKNSVLYIYKNGKFKGQSYNYSEDNPIGKIIPQDTPSPLCIGKRMDVNEYFEGIIDDFRIYNRALLDEEIEELFIIPEFPKIWVLYGFTTLILLTFYVSIVFRDLKKYER